MLSQWAVWHSYPSCIVVLCLGPDVLRAFVSAVLWHNYCVRGGQGGKLGRMDERGGDPHIHFLNLAKKVPSRVKTLGPTIELLN